MIEPVIVSPTVAVLLAAYNGALWLPEQLSSILLQRGVTTVVFVSVDFSTDGTEALVSEAAKNDPRIVVLPHGRRFGGAARNFFRLIRDVDFSGFDYISLADQDDIWYPNKLARAVDAINNEGVDCYSSNVIAFWPDGREMLIDKAQKQQEFDFLFEAAGPGCTYVMKREFVEELMAVLSASSSEALQLGLHDWFIYAFARSRGYRWMIDPQPSMAYRQHHSNQVGVNTGWTAYRARARKIVGGWGITQARLIARLLGLDKEPFCKPWRRRGRIGMVWLALNAYRARRKVSDRFVFAAACLLMAVVGDRSDE